MADYLLFVFFFSLRCCCSFLFFFRFLFDVVVFAINYVAMISFTTTLVHIIILDCCVWARNFVEILFWWLAGDKREKQYWFWCSTNVRWNCLLTKNLAGTNIRLAFLSLPSSLFLSPVHTLLFWVCKIHNVPSHHRIYIIVISHRIRVRYSVSTAKVCACACANAWAWAHKSTWKDVDPDNKVDWEKEVQSNKINSILYRSFYLYFKFYWPFCAAPAPVLICLTVIEASQLDASLFCHINNNVLCNCFYCSRSDECVDIDVVVAAAAAMLWLSWLLLLVLLVQVLMLTRSN